MHDCQDKAGQSVVQIGAQAVVPQNGLTNAFSRPMFGSGMAFLFSGLPGSGKTSLGRELALRLMRIGQRVTLLDGEALRSTISPDLGFSRCDRNANVRRAALVATEVVKHGGICICSFIAPYEQSRVEIRQAVQRYGMFFLVYVSTPLLECERRDPKGLYRQARAGLVEQLTGISDTYEVPFCPEIVIDTTGLPVNIAADRVVRELMEKGLSLAYLLAADAQTLRSDFAPGMTDVKCSRHVRHIEIFKTVILAASEHRTNLAALSRNLGTERHTIEKVVRTFTGRNFRQIQQDLLMERANRLLGQGKAVKEVAFDLGFGSSQAFVRFVKRSCGITPSALRRSAWPVGLTGD